MSGTSAVGLGIGRAEADGRYLARYRPAVGANPGLPGAVGQTAPDGLTVLRGANPALLVFQRYNGTEAAPTALALNDVAGAINFAGWDGAAMSANVNIRATALEAWTGTNKGMGLLFRTTRLANGTSTSSFQIEHQTGGPLLRAMTATAKLIPNTAWQLRNPADSATLIEWNATGLGLFGATPIARPTVTGSRGGNAALASFLTAMANLGAITDSTTA